MKLCGPYRLEMKVVVTDGSETDGEVTYSFPPGRVPTQAELDAAVEAAIARTKEVNPALRAMTKREFWDYTIRERFGDVGTFALPGSEEWDKP